MVLSTSLSSPAGGPVLPDRTLNHSFSGQKPVVANGGPVESLPASQQRVLSAQELRVVGARLGRQERFLGAAQERVDHIREMIRERERERRSDAGTYRRDDLALAEASYQEALSSYQSYRSSLGEDQYRAAKRAAPQDYNSGAVGPPPGTNSSVKYARPDSFTPARPGTVITSTGTKDGRTEGYVNSQGSRYQALSPGVYQAQAGGQVAAGTQVVVQDKKASTAGQLVTSLQGKPFTPGSLNNPPQLRGKAYGVVQEGNLNLGRNALVFSDEKGKPGNVLNTIPLTSINGYDKLSNRSFGAGSSILPLAVSGVQGELASETGNSQRLQEVESRVLNLENSEYEIENSLSVKKYLTSSEKLGSLLTGGATIDFPNGLVLSKSLSEQVNITPTELNQRGIITGGAQQVVQATINAPVSLPIGIFFGIQKPYAALDVALLPSPLKITGGLAQNGRANIINEAVFTGKVSVSNNISITKPLNQQVTFRSSSNVPLGLMGQAGSRIEQGPFSFVPGGTPVNQQGAATVITAMVGGLLGYQSAKNNVVVRAYNAAVNPRYVPLADTGVAFVEGNTVPTQLSELRSFEGREVPAGHITPSDPFQGGQSFVATARPQGAGAFRSQYELFNFYKSSPQTLPGGLLQPRAYLGYAGIGEAASSSPKVIYGKPDINLLLFRERVSSTPQGLGSIEAINRYQIARGGKTFVPAENIAGSSVEGQLISPSKYVNPSTGLPLAGYPETPGSLISKAGPERFTYYKQELQPLLGVIPRSNYFRINLIPARTSGLSGNAIVASGTPVLDLAEYGPSYSRGVEYASPSGRLASVGAVSLLSRNSSASLSESSLASSSSLGVSRPTFSLSRPRVSSPSPALVSSVPRSTSPSGSPSLRSPLKNRSSGSSFSSLLSASAGSSLSSSPRLGSRVSSQGLSATPPATVSPSREFLVPGKASSGFERKRRYNVLVRRRGKFGLIGTEGSVGEATRLGQAKARTTLARSFKVTDEGGRALGLGDLGRDFRGAKRERGVFVQRSEFSLSNPFEVREIQQAKRSSPKRKSKRGGLFS